VAEVAGTIAKADPVGAGWFRLARGQLVKQAATQGFEAELWWNPARAIIATAFGLGFGWFVLLIMLMLMRVGASLAHREAFRHEQRMTAAINYGTAWFLPMLTSACVVALRPLAYVGAVAGWAWMPGDPVIRLVAGLIAGFGAAMWWFWLVRLGYGAPASTRQGVTLFFLIGVPVIVGACLIGWWHAVRYVSVSLFGVLNLAF
jgi:hypothetical protein